MVSKPLLVGWDDGKLYYYDGDEEKCINDYPDLFGRLISVIKDYFEKKL